jgi:hypothetical protein
MGLLGGRWHGSGRASGAVFLTALHRQNLRKCEPTGPRYVMNSPRYLPACDRSRSRRRSKRRISPCTKGRRSTCTSTWPKCQPASSSEREISSLVLLSSIGLVLVGINTRDPKQQLHFGQRQTYQARPSLQNSQLSGAISSLLH